MDNNEKEVAINANSYEASPEFNITSEYLEANPTRPEGKLEWKSVIRKYLRDEGSVNLNTEEPSTPWVLTREEVGLPLLVETEPDWNAIKESMRLDMGFVPSESEDIPWFLNREDMGLPPLAGGTSIKEIPLLPKEKSDKLVFMTDGKLNPEDQETVGALGGIPTQEQIAKSREEQRNLNVKLTPGMLDDTPQGADNAVNLNLTTAFTERIKRVNNNLNPTETVDDNKPKLK